MINELPKDIDDAKAKGYIIFEEKKEDSELFNEMIARNLTPILNCTPETENKPCGEGPCIGGIKRVYFCTGGQCAYRYIEQPCS